MSSLKVTINFIAASSIIKGLRSQIKNLLNWLDTFEDMLDKAVMEQKKDKHSGDSGSWPS